MAEENNAQYSCIMCDKSFTSIFELFEHREAHLPFKLNICVICGSSFLTPKILKLHLKVYHRTRYCCHVCSKVFETPSGLTRHIQNHLEIQHICDSCNQSFKQWEYLREHSYFCRHSKNKH